MSSLPSTNLDELLAALLRGDPLDRNAIKGFGGATIHAAAVAHDVLPMVADRLALAPEVPIDLRELFLEELHRITALDLAVEAELRRMHAAFEARQVPLLLVKGSHLAYTHYPRPDLRARVDSDVLVSPAQRELAQAILTEDLGYEAPAKFSGELTATQTSFIRYDNGAPIHMVDLHWRLASPQVFAHVLTFDELYAAAVPVRALGPWARVPCGVHAMLIACMHRIAHHHDEEDTFKWLIDIHLLASDFAAAEWVALADLIVERKVSAVCLDSLRTAAFWFRTAIPASFEHDARFAAARQTEATASYLRERPKAEALLDDLRALPRWSDRARLMGEHLFPGADYMRQVYAPGSSLPLPALYVVRACRGVLQWLR